MSFTINPNPSNLLLTCAVLTDCQVSLALSFVHVWRGALGRQGQSTVTEVQHGARLGAIELQLKYRYIIQRQHDITQLRYMHLKNHWELGAARAM